MEQGPNQEDINVLSESDNEVHKEDELQKALLENQDLQQQLIRSLADFQNFRRRTMQEKEEIRKFATEQLIHELLPVLDAFQKTVHALNSESEINSIKEGVKMIDRMLNQALETARLEKMQVVGKIFDPNLHEAISIETSEEHPDQYIIEELSCGYVIGEKILRPAKVKVIKNS